MRDNYINSDVVGNSINYFKKYSEMNYKEKNLVLNFFLCKSNEINSIEKLDSMFKGKIYDRGNGVIFYLNDKEILGKIAVVLECIEPLKKAFIHGIEINNKYKSNIEVLKKLINESKAIATEYGAKDIKLGIRDKEILKTLEKANIYKDYCAIKMSLSDREKREEVLELEELTKENSEKYLITFNDSFSDMPHGTWLDNDGLSEFLNSKSDNKYYFMVKEKEKIIGFMNCEIENNEGVFDIGLCKEYRGRGLGKILLETAINFLNTRNVEKISLIVIEKNIIAHEMYKKRGFLKENTISYWIEL